MSLEFSVDRGGTFTDVVCGVYDSEHRLLTVDQLKLLSEDYHYEDSITEGIRIMLNRQLNLKLNQNDKLPAQQIRSVRIGTTIGTNALLERKGARTGLVMTKGFKDLLIIGNQSRPKIFELNIKRNLPIYEESIEIDERIEYMSDIEFKSCGSPNLERYKITKSINEKEVEYALRQLYDKGIDSLAISLIHSYALQQNELTVERIAKDIGFKSVYCSHKSNNKMGYLSRTSTCLLDAYLFPVIHKYLQNIRLRFDQPENLKLYLMQSDGSLVGYDQFSGSKSILSGPSGGVSGFSKTTYFGNEHSSKMIGFDMGGTSTDVSTFEGNYEMNYESEIAGVFVSIPHLDINTVAAGGGSCLGYEDRILTVGPKSAGSNPGPICYGKDEGKLAITDINLILGRILPEYFPSIFGKNQDEPLNYDLSASKFSELASDIRNKDFQSFGNKSDQEIALGFIKVANEIMCRPIRSLTESRGKDPKSFDLVVFGGAGSQHACSIANNLGIKRIFVHKYASILSAYGIFLSDITSQDEMFINKNIQLLDELFINQEIKVKQSKLVSAQSSDDLKKYLIATEITYCLNYKGTDSIISVIREFSGLSAEHLYFERDSILPEFFKIHYEQFGFNLEKRDVILSKLYIKLKLQQRNVEEIDRLISKSKKVVDQDIKKIRPSKRIFFLKSDKENRDFNSNSEVLELDVPIIFENELEVGSKTIGPAIIILNGSSLLVEPGWECLYNYRGSYELNIATCNIQSILKEVEHKNIPLKVKVEEEVQNDSVMLTIFGHRFMSIAEQMGRRLQRTSLSTNIKERLDFSCAVFGPDGSLVANAPHLPVHLGSMESAVKFQIDYLGSNFKENDVVISNHPVAGGSHLPDITAITPVFFENKPIFYVASRGHHADIGGKSPGSMPAFAESITEEGVSFISLKLIEDGKFMEEELVDCLLHPKNGAIGTRNLEDNISDLKAQISSNKKGVELLLKLVEEYGLNTVHAYMNYIQDAAELSVKSMLRQISINNNLKEIDTVTQEDYMDNGSNITLHLTINRIEGTALFDFTKCGTEVLGNFNSPVSVLKSAIIYCMRCLVDSDIPLNAGCLRPIKIQTKPGTIVDPSEEAAIVGGNVTTSQRITDVILKAFKAAADSQGCMNNFTFGDETFGYYETVAGGSGAGPSWNGVDGVQCHMTNTRITDPEILEFRYPVTLLEFKIRLKSGGDGKFKGGNGVIRSFIFKKDLQISLLTERRVLAPQGICGGENGERGLNILSKNERLINLGGKCQTNVKIGWKLSILTPGGGGYGLKLLKSQDSDSKLKETSISIGSHQSFIRLQEQS